MNDIVICVYDKRFLECGGIGEAHVYFLLYIVKDDPSRLL